MISPLIVPDPLTAHALKQLGFATVARVEKPVNKLRLSTAAPTVAILA